jgi:hypothetical protein
MQGEQCRFERNGGSLNKANSPASSCDRVLPVGSGGNQRDAPGQPRHGWRVSQSVAAPGLVLKAGCAALSRPTALIASAERFFPWGYPLSPETQPMSVEGNLVYGSSG